jgi:predicted  nucleic acid-binding Zn-ribbon protein
MSSFPSLLLLGLSLVLGGCAGTYYKTMEKLGVPKRQILVDRVEEARGAQQAAKEQFASALHEFLAVTKVPATELQKTYAGLKDQLDTCEKRATAVRDRIEAIESVAQALFVEWSEELTQYNNPNLRAQSARQLETTKRRYTDLRRVMDQAAARMEPVLVTFRDNVLFLKHNLNAQAVASLDSTTRALQGDIGRLVADMEKAIKEADAFISAMKTVGQ